MADDLWAIRIIELQPFAVRDGSTEVIVGTEADMRALAELWQNEKNRPRHTCYEAVPVVEAGSDTTGDRIYFVRRG